MGYFFPRRLKNKDKGKKRSLMSLGTLLDAMLRSDDDDSPQDAIDLLLGSGKRKPEPEPEPEPGPESDPRPGPAEKKARTVTFEEDDDEEDTLPISGDADDEEEEEEPKCLACREDQPNQEAHYGGCMPDPSQYASFDIDDVPRPPPPPDLGRRKVKMVLQEGTSLDTLVKLHAVAVDTGNRTTKRDIENVAEETDWTLEEYRVAFRTLEFPLLETLLFRFYPLLFESVVGEPP
jgi:hypothetical protein